MSFISNLVINHLRNISSAKLNLHSQCNFFHGANGSGKTSLLEAIYLLGTGHSFRTREISPLVTHGAESLTIFARTASDETISIQKSVSGPTQVKLNRQSCFSSSELARFLPCQIFYQDIFQIIDAGPLIRRTLLDWGLFHVEPSYLAVWKDYRTVLKHRNALLRQKAPVSNFVPWDMKLVELAVELDRMRECYFEQWFVLFHVFLEKLTNIPCSISYFKGWDKKGTGKHLSVMLAEQLPQDLQRQYTGVGAHQADIIFDLSSKKAKLLLSRGQQKIVLIALKLAQAALVKRPCLYLFDDVAAELDSAHLSRLMECLSEIKGQLFITAMDSSLITKLQAQLSFNSFNISDGLLIPA